MPLAAILVVAAVARLWGIHFGLPHANCRPDEGSIAAIAGGFYHGSLNPHTFNYPALFMLAVAAVMLLLYAGGQLLSSLSIRWSLEVAATTTTFRIARYLSAAAGIASVAVIHSIAHRLFGRATALAAAALLALAFLHVRDSHFGVTDVPMAFMVLVAFLFVVRFSESSATRDLIAAGVTSGLATSTKYNAALIALPALLAIATSPAGTGEHTRVRLQRAALYASLLVAAFLLTSPYSVLDYRRFWADVTFESRHLAGGHGGLILGRGWSYHLTTTLRHGVGVPLLSAGICGFLLLLWQDRRKGALVALFPVSYYVVLGSGYTVFARYMLPVVPFICLAAAYAVTETAAWLARRVRRAHLTPLLATCGVVALLLPSARSVVEFDSLIARPDSRLLARGWVERQFPEGTTIGQLGRESGHVFVGDGNEKKYARVPFVWRSPRPDLVIVNSSPLWPQEDAFAGMKPILNRYYELGFARTVAAADPANVYDRQDDFYVPLAGFKSVERPGPNLEIYILRGSFPNVPRVR